MPGKNRRVVQYDRLGNVLGVYPNAKSAAFAVGTDVTSISRCCNGERKIGGGYVWTFEGNKPDLDGVKPPIKRYDLLGNYIESFNSVSDVEDKYSDNITVGNLRLCLSGQTLFYNNSFWIYAGQEKLIPEKVEKYGRQIIAKTLDKRETIYYGNIQLAHEETGIPRPMINRALKGNALCKGYAWFRYPDKQKLKDFEDFKLYYPIFGHREKVIVDYPNGMQKEFESIAFAAQGTGQPAHLLYCLGHGTEKNKSRGYKVILPELKTKGI